MQVADAMLRAFPNDEILADYASGALSPGLSLLVACHLTYAPESRRRVADLETVGGLMLAEEQPNGIAPPSLDAVLAQLDAIGDAPAPRPRLAEPAGGDLILPAPLRALVGPDPSRLGWKFRLPGLSETHLDGFDGEEVSLLRARPGAPMFAHTHSGVEATLVLTGLMEDRGEVFGRGDVTIATEADDHRPRIVGDEVCYCLIVMSGNLRFTGPFSRALNLLAE